MKQGFAARRDNNFQVWYFLTSNAKGITQFWCLTDSNFFVLLDDLLYSALRASPYGSPKSGDQIESFVFLHAQKESK
ncbi:MAG: hypothetical protein ACJA1I_001890 [Zhongshania marina]